jgi:hypothetical protein
MEAPILNDDFLDMLHALGRETLIKNKRAAARDKDLLDVKALLKES